MEPMVIEVLGVPCVPHYDRMADQLKIHFLKRRNNGGDVLKVIYPTCLPGQAYVVFEADEVPGVLECCHIIEIDNSFYPVHVKKSHLSQVDMPVKTMLDLRFFQNPQSVMDLLEYYDFNVTKHAKHHLQLKGSFLKLKLVRNQLAKLQVREPQQTSSAPVALRNGSSSVHDSERDGLDDRFVSKSTSKNPDANCQRRLLGSAQSSSSSSSYRDMETGGSAGSLQSGCSSYAERNTGSPADAVQKSQLPGISTSYRNVALSESPRIPHNTHCASIGSTRPKRNNDFQKECLCNEIPTYRRDPLVDVPSSSSSSKNYSPSCTSHQETFHSDSELAGDFRQSPSCSGETLASSTHSKPSSPHEGMVSIPVDSDTLNFILSQRQDVVNMIKKSYGTKMVTNDNDGITMVTFLGRNCDKAKTYLLDNIKDISPLLRAQEIHLTIYDHAEKQQIIERVQNYKDMGVWISLSDDVVKLVGSSRGSFEMMQKLLGQNDNPRKGRTTERSSKVRRSSSLPRHYKITDNAQSTDHENRAGSSNRYCPARYQDEADGDKARQIVQNPGQVSEKKSKKGHRGSDSRDINIPRESPIQDVELVAASQGKKFPKKAPDLLKLLTPNPSHLDFKKLMTRKSHSSAQK